jgi:Transposase
MAVTTILSVTRAKAWVGVDHDRPLVLLARVDPNGMVLLSRRVANDEQAILELLAVAGALADELVWAVDLARGYNALLLAVLWDHRQQVVYVPGRAVNRASDGYRGESKTDAKDARVIADQARMRRDFAALTPPGELLAELRLLVADRRDLAGRAGPGCGAVVRVRAGGLRGGVLQPALTGQRE